MQKSALTIRLKLMIAFGTCATLMCAVGLVGILGLWHLKGHVPASYRLLFTALIAVAWTGCLITVSSGIHLHRVVCGGLNRMSTRFEEIATTLDLSMRARSPRMDEFALRRLRSTG